MPQYLLSVIQPDGDPPPPEVLGPIMERVFAWRREIKDAGAWVFGAGLESPTSATVVRHRDGEVVYTDGPFAEGKEHVGGFIIIRAPDLDAALEWARKAAWARGLAIEVRPLRGEVEG